MWWKVASSTRGSIPGSFGVPETLNTLTLTKELHRILLIVFHNGGVFTLDCECFPSVGYSIAEYQRILSIQEIRHLAFDCVLIELSLCRRRSKNLRANNVIKFLVEPIDMDFWRLMPIAIFRSQKCIDISANIYILKQIWQWSLRCRQQTLMTRKCNG